MEFASSPNRMVEEERQTGRLLPKIRTVAPSMSLLETEKKFNNLASTIPLGTNYGFFGSENYKNIVRKAQHFSVWTRICQVHNTIFSASRTRAYCYRAFTWAILHRHFHGQPPECNVLPLCLGFYMGSTSDW